MSNPAPVLEQTTPQTLATGRDESLGIDREFVTQMARMPLLALLWVGASFVAYQIWAAIWPTGLNAGPLVVISFGMILAAFIDGWALKVPNWITLPLVLSGWMLGARCTISACRLILAPAVSAWRSWERFLASCCCSRCLRFAGSAKAT